MNEVGKGLAFGALIAVALATQLDLFSGVAAGTPRIYVGALVLTLLVAVAFVVTLVGSTRNWPEPLKNAAAAAVSYLSIGAAGFAIVGLVAAALIPAADGQPNSAAQAVGLILILLVGGLSLLGTAAPTVAWSKVPVITTLVAMVMVAAYGAVILYMLNRVDAAAATWDRYLVLFTAVQSVGLAAVGALLGTQVKQAEVDQAKAEVKEAKEEVKETEQEVEETQSDVREVLLAHNEATSRSTPEDDAQRAAGRIAEIERKYR